MRARGSGLVPLVNVADLARDGSTWRGAVAVTAFERLGNMLFGAADSSRAENACVSADLDFALDDEGRPRVQGMCKLVAPICCSRCAETVEVEVESRVDLRVVATEAELQRLMPAFDATVGGGASLPLTALIEDDILLSIPRTACADGADCVHARAVSVEVAEVPEAKPFAALRALFGACGPDGTENPTMAVQQNKVTRSKRDKRRSHHALKAPTLATDSATGERHRRHHVTDEGYYRGRKVLESRR